jgi:hypothetical protein
MQTRLLLILLLIAAAGCAMPRPALAQDIPLAPDDDLRPFAVNVAKTRPFEKQFNGDGVYLGGGITRADRRARPAGDGGFAAGCEPAK